jgi:hypothetical protein
MKLRGSALAAVDHVLGAIGDGLDILTNAADGVARRYHETAAYEDAANHQS